jgi:branched-chain amino acid transport system substrate-binding protein
VFARAGYPLIAVTASTDRAPEFAKRWPNSFWIIGTGTTLSASAVEVFAKLRQEGKIGNKVAMIGVADQFGIEFSSSARKSLAAAKFELVYDKSYPLGSQDMQPILTEAKRLNADVFLAASYPPDTFNITAQAKVIDFNPKVFFTSVGTAFPAFKARFKEETEGIMGTGGVDADSPAWKDYLKRHVAVIGSEPDRWASPMTYSSLQMLQQAIERVGKIDRPAIIKELQTGSFDTIIGKIKLTNNVRSDGFQTGQWQGGDYYGIGPSSMPGVRAPIVPKPAWKK